MLVEVSIWLIIVPVLFSGLIVYVFSIAFYARHERRKEKLSVLEEIMGNRYGLTPSSNAEVNARFFQVLNSIFTVFHDSRRVVKALRVFKQHKGRAADNVTQLIMEMGMDLKIDTSYLEDSFFKDLLIPTGPATRTHNKTLK